MATDFTRDAVLSFIWNRGGRVKNADLLNHFKKFLRDDENRTQNRELFKTFVNTVAVVKPESGVAFVVLRKRYRGQAGEVFAPSSDTKKTKPREISRDSEGIHKGQIDLGLKSKRYHEFHDDNVSPRKCTDEMYSNNNVETERSNNTMLVFSQYIYEPTTPAVNAKRISNSTRKLDCDYKAVNDNSVKPEKVGGYSSVRESVSCTSLQLAVRNGIHCANESIGTEKLQQSRELLSKGSFCPSPVYTGNESKVHLLEDLKECNAFSNEQAALGCVVESRTLPTAPRKVSSILSSPPSESGLSGVSDGISGYKVICSNEWLQRSNEAINLRGMETPIAVRLCHSQPLENHKSPFSTIHYPASLSASYGNLPLPSNEDNDNPQGSPREDKVSDNLVKFKRLSDGQGSKVNEMLNRAEESKQLPRLLSTERKLTGRHNSSSCLSYQDSRAADAALEDGTSASLHSRAQRMSGEQRNRMCQSLGENLDKPFHEDGISSSHNRLSLLSSSLSMNPTDSSPPLQKQRKITSAPPDVSVDNIPLAKDRPNFHKVSLAPLDPKEHDWLVKAAAGSWINIYSLFREEPSLLTKRDFISGYTVLHWIAKHGDHRVLNTLWYGVNKAGMTLDVDIKTTCGYTPLHLAAIHGHKKLIRLLVHKYKANVAMRDSSGRKPWQYLGKSGPRDLLQLLGAPQRKKIGGTVRQSASEKLSAQPATVKRETSITAFLKHKSLLKVPAHIESLVQGGGDGE